MYAPCAPHTLAASVRTAPPTLLDLFLSFAFIEHYIEHYMGAQQRQRLFCVNPSSFERVTKAWFSLLSLSLGVSASRR